MVLLLVTGIFALPVLLPALSEEPCEEPVNTNITTNCRTGGFPCNLDQLSNRKIPFSGQVLLKEGWKLDSLVASQWRIWIIFSPLWAETRNFGISELVQSLSVWPRSSEIFFVLMSSWRCCLRHRSFGGLTFQYNESSLLCFTLDTLQLLHVDN